MHVEQDTEQRITLELEELISSCRSEGLVQDHAFVDEHNFRLRNTDGWIEMDRGLAVVYLTLLLRSKDNGFARFLTEDPTLR